MEKNSSSHLITMLMIVFLLVLLTASACNRPVKSTEPGEPTATLQTSTQEIVPTLAPSPTSLPLAASVNGEGILLEDINNEILRYLMADPESSITNAFNVTINDRIDLLLLAQAARTSGYEISPEEIDQRIENLVGELGSREQFDQWLAQNHYTVESFQHDLKIMVEAEYQRAYLAAEIPAEMEQVELRQILVYDETTAKQIQQALDANTDFDWLVSQYHPLTKGYLGWHAPGTLLQPMLEETVWLLETGQVSSAIKSDYGYHFIKVIQKETRPLSTQNRQHLEELILINWISQQREMSEINIIATVDE